MIRITLKLVLIGVFVVLLGAAAYFGYGEYRSLADRVATVNDQLSSTKRDLAGYTKYTDYIIKGKESLQGSTQLLTAKMTQDVQWVEHVEKKVLLFKSSGTVALTLSVEYAFGFDLAAGKYDLVPTNKGLGIRVGRPIPVARPSVALKSWKILSGSLLVDEKQAALNLLARIQPVFDEEAARLAQTEAVMALCEKKLIDHVGNVLAKQPGVSFVPRITVAYR